MEMVKMMKQMRERQSSGSERVDNQADRNMFAPTPTSGPLLSQKGKVRILFCFFFLLLYIYNINVVDVTSTKTEIINYIKKAIETICYC